MLDVSLIVGEDMRVIRPRALETFSIEEKEKEVVSPPPWYTGLHGVSHCL